MALGAPVNRTSAQRQWSFVHFSDIVPSKYWRPSCLIIDVCCRVRSGSHLLAVGELPDVLIWFRAVAANHITAPREFIKARPSIYLSPARAMTNSQRVCERWLSGHGCVRLAIFNTLSDLAFGWLQFSPSNSQAYGTGKKCYLIGC